MADTPKAYAIDAVEGVAVQLDDSSEDETFTIAVVKENEVVETHDGVTSDSIEGISSEHFTVSVIDAPVAPPDVEDDDE